MCNESSYGSTTLACDLRSATVMKVDTLLLILDCLICLWYLAVVAVVVWREL